MTLDEILEDIKNKMEAAVDSNGHARDFMLEVEANDGNVKAAIKSIIEGYDPEGIEEALPGVVKVANFDGGGEGSAEDSPECIFKYVPTGQLFGITGWYQSYHGTDWDEDFMEFEQVMVPSYQVKK